MKANKHIIGIDLDNLKSIIGQTVAKELQNIKLNFKTLSIPTNETILTRKEAAEFLKVSLQTLWELDRDGELPANRIKSKVVYMKKNLIKYLNQN